MWWGGVDRGPPCFGEVETQAIQVGNGLGLGVRILPRGNRRAVSLWEKGRGKSVIGTFSVAERYLPSQGRVGAGKWVGNGGRVVVPCCGEKWVVADSWWNKELYPVNNE